MRSPAPAESMIEVAKVSNDEILDHMHRLHLVLADEVKRVCEKHGIKYFMIAGTLLGAVRHQGFIPWDDDMDFGMLRPDFERFLQVCEAEIDPKKFYLQTDRNDKYYTFNFAKLRLNGTKVYEAFSSEVNIHQGIYIDIFPMDAVPDHPIKTAVQYRSFWLVRTLLWIKCGYGEQAHKTRLLYKAARQLTKPLSIDFLKKLKHRIITCCMGEKTRRIVTSDGTYGLKQETLDAKWTENIRDYPFEDRVYPGIADYDEYLSYLYGDYRKLPPKEQQNHHLRLEVDFGVYGESPCEMQPEQSENRR